jgi:hypothetical protein
MGGRSPPSRLQPARQRAAGAGPRGAAPAPARSPSAAAHRADGPASPRPARDPPRRDAACARPAQGGPDARRPADDLGLGCSRPRARHVGTVPRAAWSALPGAGGRRGVLAAAEQAQAVRPAETVHLTVVARGIDRDQEARLPLLSTARANDFQGARYGANSVPRASTRLRSGDREEPLLSPRCAPRPPHLLDHPYHLLRGSTTRGHLRRPSPPIWASVAAALHGAPLGVGRGRPCLATRPP